MSARRPLAFKSLDEIMPDVDRLLSRGYSKVGNWSLGQTCNHLSRDFIGPIEGYSFKAPWIARTLFAPLILRQVLKTEKIREQVKVPAAALPDPSKQYDDRAEAEALRAAIQLYKANTKPLLPHPFFGKQTKETTDHLTRIHSAHHLSFLIPTNA